MIRSTLGRGLVALSVVAACTAPALSQVQLKHKYKAGKGPTIQRITRLEQKLSIAGMDQDTATENISSTTITVGEPDSDGKVSVQEKVNSMQATIKAGGIEYLFDSANPDNAGTSPLEILRPVHKAMTTSVTTTIFDKSGRAVQVKTDQNILANLPEQAKILVEGQLDPENLKDAANQRLDILPKDPVKPGDTWDRSEVANFGAGQMMTFNRRYKYEGEVEKDGKRLDKITAELLAVDFSLANDSPLPLSVKGATLKPAESSTTILFDREAGSIVESKSTSHIKGTIDFEANGQPLPAVLDLTMTTEMTQQE